MSINILVWPTPQTCREFRHKFAGIRNGFVASPWISWEILPSRCCKPVSALFVMDLRIGVATVGKAPEWDRGPYSLWVCQVQWVVGNRVSRTRTIRLYGRVSSGALPSVATRSWIHHKSAELAYSTWREGFSRIQGLATNHPVCQQYVEIHDKFEGRSDQMFIDILDQVNHKPPVFVLHDS